MKDLTVTVTAELTFSIKSIPEDHEIPDHLRAGPMVTEDEASDELRSIVEGALGDEFADGDDTAEVNLSVEIQTVSTASYSASYPVPEDHPLRKVGL